MTSLTSKWNLSHGAPALLGLLMAFGAFAQDNAGDNGDAGTPAAAESPAISEEARAVLPLSDLRTFADVFSQIRLGYVEEVDDSTLLEYAIEGMLSGLDPHSVYLTADDFEDLQSTTSGEFSGLGLEVGMENGFVKVISPIDDTPADKAGIETGDIILKLDNKPLKGLSLNEAIDLMRGPKGSSVGVTIAREGQKPFDVELVRDTVRTVSVRKRWLEPGYGYLRIAQFQRHTGEEVQKALTSLQAEEELKGIVLDLRNNPGGVLRASVDVAEHFIDGGTVVYTEGRLEDNAQTRYNASPEDILDGAPIVVLINGGSASASEVVAGALQDHRRAVVMGTQSFGKGSVQTILPISEDRAIKLTTALYFTPNGRSIQAQGIMPDIEVERARVTTIDRSRRITEADLAGRLDNANGEDGVTEARKSSGNELLSQDNQLYEALTLLKGIHILSMYDAGKP